MTFKKSNWFRVALVVMVAAGAVSCSNEFTRSAAPVELIATNTQDIQQIDLAGDPVGETFCQGNIGTIVLRALLKAPSNVDQRFNDVRVTRYRVSYVRTDGGTLVPAPFVRSVDILVPAGGTGDLATFQVFQSDAIVQAPFASLFPQNGGRDPETGRPVVRLDVIMDFFGETLAGSNVAARTRFPLDFCFQCGGCG